MPWWRIFILCVCVCVCVCVPSHVQLFVTPWTIARQTPLSVNFPQGYWSGLPFPPPGDLPNPGIEPTSPGSPALAGVFFTTAHLGSHFFSWQRLSASAVMKPLVSNPGPTHSCRILSLDGCIFSMYFFCNEWYCDLMCKVKNFNKTLKVVLVCGRNWVCYEVYICFLQDVQ